MQQISRAAKPGYECEDGERVYWRDAAVVASAAMGSVCVSQVKVPNVEVPEPSYNRQKAQHQSCCKADEEEGFHVICFCLRIPSEYALLKLLSQALKVNRSFRHALQPAAGVR